MLIDQFGELIPNRQETAICCECGQRNNVKNMKERTYPIAAQITVLVRFCNTKFCIDENSRMVPGRIDELRGLSK